MNRKLKLFLLALVILMAVPFLTGCSQEEDPYVKNDAENYSVSVKFDANGGFFDSGLGDDMMWLLLFILLLITIILLILYKLFMNMASVSLDAIAAAFESGAEVTLETLKEKELISKNIVKVRIKAKKDTVLDKALNIEAHSATKRADELVRGANGRIITKKSKKEAQD